MIQDPIAVAGVILAILAVLFTASKHPVYGKIFNYIPLIVFAYFVPTLLSNTGVLPMDSSAYVFIKKVLLPASLLLLTLSIDIPAIVRLGPKSLAMFFAATASVFVGSLIAYAIGGRFIPKEMHEQAWRGLAALCGSWIGGGANFVAVGESVKASTNIMGLMVIVDVVVASAWLAILFYFAGREKKMDEKIKADRRSLDDVLKKMEKFKTETSRPPSLVDFISLGAVSIGGVALCAAIASKLPDVGTLINGFTWVVILITALGIGLSFTPARRLEAGGASVLGSTFLYMLISTIGAQGNFREIPNAPAFVLIGVLWMTFHAVFMLLFRRWLKAPIFFLAVGSQANIGAAASAPVVASAFHPSLAPVGVLLAILGYALGTYLALLNAFFLERIYRLLFA